MTDVALVSTKKPTTPASAAAPALSFAKPTAIPNANSSGRFSKIPPQRWR